MGMSRTSRLQRGQVMLLDMPFAYPSPRPRVTKNVPDLATFGEFHHIIDSLGVLMNDDHVLMNDDLY